MFGNFRLKEAICILDTIAVSVVASFTSPNLVREWIRYAKRNWLSIMLYLKFYKWKRKCECKMRSFKRSPFKQFFLYYVVDIILVLNIFPFVDIDG